jgi:hypothetical protein
LSDVVVVVVIDDEGRSDRKLECRVVVGGDGAGSGRLPTNIDATCSAATSHALCILSRNTIERADS